MCMNACARMDYLCPLWRRPFRLCVRACVRASARTCVRGGGRAAGWLAWGRRIQVSVALQRHAARMHVDSRTHCLHARRRVHTARAGVRHAPGMRNDALHRIRVSRAARATTCPYCRGDGGFVVCSAIRYRASFFCHCASFFLSSRISRILFHIAQLRPFATRHLFFLFRVPFFWLSHISGRAWADTAGDARCTQPWKAHFGFRTTMPHQCASPSLRTSIHVSILAIGTLRTVPRLAEGRRHSRTVANEHRHAARHACMPRHATHRTAPHRTAPAPSCSHSCMHARTLARLHARTLAPRLRVW